MKCGGSAVFVLHPAFCIHHSAFTEERPGFGPRMAGMSDVSSQEKPTAVPSSVPSSRVFLRLLRLLRPYWMVIGLGLLLLLLSTPCELFPAIVWRYVTDDVVLQKHTSPRLTGWFSFGGRVHGQYAMLVSSVAWLLVIYLLGELMGTLSTWIMN